MVSRQKVDMITMPGTHVDPDLLIAPDVSVSSNNGGHSCFHQMSGVMADVCCQISFESFHIWWETQEKLTISLNLLH